MLLLRTIPIQTLVIRQLIKVPSCVTTMSEKQQWVHYYNGPETSVNLICDQFSKYEGGKVDLLKDDETGIAIIKINHPERRNALSGNS